MDPAIVAQHHVEACSQQGYSCAAAVPRQYQPDIIMLLPKLLEPADHATAANLLIAHLAEATRLGAAAEALIRLPVLATLGLLTVDAGTAKKLLTAVLNVSSLDQMLCTKGLGAGGTFHSTYGHALLFPRHT